MASLTALPSELFAGVVEHLDLGSTVRLACTARSLSHLSREHRHYPIYSAVQSADMTGFRSAITAIRKLGTSSHGHAETDEDLYTTILACVWALIVDRDCTDLEWWSPLSFLVSNLNPVVRPFNRDGHNTENARLFARLLNNGAKLSRVGPLERFREMQKAAPQGWLDHSDDCVSTSTLIKSILQNKHQLWTLRQQLELLPLVVKFAKEVEVFVSLPDDGDCIMDALVATQNLSLIVAYVVHQNQFLDITVLIDFLTLFVMASGTDHAHPTDLFIKSYLVALQSALPTTYSPTLEISFARPLHHIRKELAETYAFAGVSTSHFSSFLGFLQASPFEHEFLPWLLSCASDQRDGCGLDFYDLKWLVSHVHLHVSMLHVLPFHRYETHGTACIHSTSTLDFVIKHIPIDLHGQQSHLNHSLVASGNKPFDSSSNCPRCLQLICAARDQAPTNPALEKFASGKWHVSYDPIPPGEWLAEARTIAQLIRSMQPASASEWMDYVDSVSPILQPPAGNGQPAARVDWLGGARGVGFNDMSISGVILGHVYEERLEEALSMVPQVEARESVDWPRIVDCVKVQVDRIVGTSEGCDTQAQAQLLAGAAALVRTLKGKCGNWMSRHTKLAEWAVGFEE